jgi:cytochrome b561
MVAIRLINRLIHPAPPLPAVERVAITASIITLYVLMFALPLVGWGCCRRRAIQSCCMDH